MNTANIGEVDAKTEPKRDRRFLIAPAVALLAIAGFAIAAYLSDEEPEFTDSGNGWSLPEEAPPGQAWIIDESGAPILIDIDPDS